MMYLRFVPVAGIVLSAACDPVEVTTGAGDGSVVEAEIVTLEDDGAIADLDFATDQINGSGSDLVTIGDEVNGYAYAYGFVDDTNDLLGVAGFAPESDPGDAITTGTVDYTGTYGLAYVGDTASRVTGDITLQASFDDLSVTGSADELEVEGTFSGTDLGGTVSYEGVTAELDGVVGESRVIGAFAGDDNESLLVGGIYADADD